MVKRILWEIVKIGLVLALGQVSYGDSTVGGEFVKGVSRATASLAGPRVVQTLSRFFAEVSSTLGLSKTKFRNLKKAELKLGVPPENTHQEESQALL